MEGSPLAGKSTLLEASIKRAGFHLRFHRQRYVNGHLVTVEVGVKRRANEGVQLDGLAFDQDGLERLDTQTVQRRRTVQHHGMLFDDLFQNIPHNWRAGFNFLFGSLNGGRNTHGF